MTSPQSCSTPLGVRSKIRPPGRPSRTTRVSASPDAVWSAGHHASIRAVQTSNAWSAGQSTSKLSRIGSITAGSRRRVGRDQREPGRRLAPDPLEVGPDRLDPLVVEAVDPARPDGLLADEARLLEQPEVARDGRPADRQRVGQLLDGRPARRAPSSSTIARRFGSPSASNGSRARPPRIADAIALRSPASCCSWRRG